MYSLRISFCTVPESFSRSAPCCRATAVYSAKRIAAVELMVMEVDTRASGMPANSVCMSSSEQIEGDGEARLALRQQIAIAGVRLARRAEAGILPHSPEFAAVHRGMNSPGVGELAGRAERRLRLEIAQIFGRVYSFERDAG